MARTRSRDDILTLAELAYAATDPGASWEPFLLELSDATKGRATVLMFHDYATQGSIGVGVRNDPTAVLDYDSHYSAIDPRALSPRARAITRPGVAVPDEALVPYASVMGTEFFEFAHRHDMSRCMTVALSRPGDSFAGISVTRAHRDDPFGKQELRLLETIAPHAARALKTRQQLERAAGATHDLAELMGRFGLGVIGVSKQGTSTVFNDYAARLLAKGDVLVLRSGRLGTALATEQPHLDALLASALALRSGDIRQTPSPVLLHSSGGRAVHVAAFLPSPLAFGICETVVLLLVTEPGEPARLDQRHLERLFQFTPAEARYAMGLASGGTTKELAERLRLTKASGRWLLEQVRMKTGAKSQAQAVAILLASAARV